MAWVATLQGLQVNGGSYSNMPKDSGLDIYLSGSGLVSGHERRLFQPELRLATVSLLIVARESVSALL